MMDADIQNTGIAAQLDLPPVLGSCENLQLWVRYSHMMPKFELTLLHPGYSQACTRFPFLALLIRWVVGVYVTANGAPDDGNS